MPVGAISSLLSGLRTFCWWPSVLEYWWVTTGALKTPNLPQLATCPIWQSDKDGFLATRPWTARSGWPLTDETLNFLTSSFGEWERPPPSSLCCLPCTISISDKSQVYWLNLIAGRWRQYNLVQSIRHSAHSQPRSVSRRVSAPLFLVHFIWC